MFKKVVKEKPKENKEEITSMKSVEVFINDGENCLKKFKYSYGDWNETENNKEVINATGYSYEDFLNQVLHQYPLYKVKSFKLIDLDK